MKTNKNILITVGCFVIVIFIVWKLTLNVVKNPVDTRPLVQSSSGISEPHTLESYVVKLGFTSQILEEIMDYKNVCGVGSAAHLILRLSMNEKQDVDRILHDSTLAIKNGAIGCIEPMYCDTTANINCPNIEGLYCATINFLSAYQNNCSYNFLLYLIRKSVAKMLLK